jgi:hypothetical protein
MRELMTELTPVLLSGDVAGCEQAVARQLKKLPHSPFHVVLDLSITNPPEEVAAHFDSFFDEEKGRFRIAAAYTEMNGFNINADRWFFDVFAFEQYGGHDDYDWLSNWQSQNYPDMTITGLESLQEGYASDAFWSGKFTDACDLTDLLVVIKFQDLIRRAAPHMQELEFPLLATAHDFDFIFEARRDPVQRRR